MTAIPESAILILSNSTVSENRAVRGIYNFAAYGGGIRNHGFYGNATVTLEEQHSY